MSTEHRYRATITWTGNFGEGTTQYTSYGRDHIISVDGKPDIAGSADPAFHGDLARYNPEDLLVASVSACHMLWYLHFCATAGVVVLAYADDASGIMAMGSAGGMRFTGITLHPKVAITLSSDAVKAKALHHTAHEACFIANSVNFPIEVAAVVEVANDRMPPRS